jgi:DNA-3-methyladenine glycosylase II
MATATKAAAKRAASQSAQAAGKAARATRAARTAGSTAAKTSMKAAAKVALKKTAKTVAGEAPGAPSKRRLNGSAGAPHVAKPTQKETRVSSTAGKTARPKANGALGVQHVDNDRLTSQLVVDTAHEGEIVRKSRASTATEAAVPVQIGSLAPEVTRPAYWDKACADLVKRDRILKKLIPKFGPVHLLSRGDPFVTLARSVVGQQISVAAAQAVWQRIEDACAKLVPQQFIKLGHERLTACGLSKRKTEYILDLAQHFVSGALHVGKWASMDDEHVIAELTQIRGIGRWTAEMFLIFNLSRPNVLPLDDLGLIRAISVNYFSGEPVTRSEAREVAANWEPWRTVATWYMWRSLEALPAGA